MEESVLLGTKPLVDSIRHVIRDPSGAYFPYVTFVSVVSFNDVTIPAFCFIFLLLFYVLYLVSISVIKRTLHVVILHVVISSIYYHLHVRKCLS